MALDGNAVVVGDALFDFENADDEKDARDSNRRHQADAV
jgi:hypothetical protein